MKKIIPLLLFLTVLGSTVYAETVDVKFNSVHLVVNNNPIEVPNILYNGNTYVPLRAVAETLNMNVGWDDTTRTASITNPSQTETEAKLSNANHALKAYKDAVYAVDVIKTLIFTLREIYSDYLRVDDIYDNFIAYPNYKGILYDADFSNQTDNINFVIDERYVANNSLRTACEITGHDYEKVESVLYSVNEATYNFNLALKHMYDGAALNSYNLDKAGTYLSTGYDILSEAFGVIVEIDNMLTNYVLGYEY